MLASPCSAIAGPTASGIYGQGFVLRPATAQEIAPDPFSAAEMAFLASATIVVAVAMSFPAAKAIIVCVSGFVASTAPSDGAAMIIACRD